MALGWQGNTHITIQAQSPHMRALVRACTHLLTHTRARARARVRHILPSFPTTSRLTLSRTARRVCGTGLYQDDQAEVGGGGCEGMVAWAR